MKGDNVRMNKQDQLKILNKANKQLSNLKNYKGNNKAQNLQDTFTTVDNEMFKAGQHDLALSDKYNNMLNKKGIIMKYDAKDMLPKSELQHVMPSTAKTDKMIKKSLDSLKQFPDGAWIQSAKKSATFEPLSVSRVQSVGKSIGTMAHHLSQSIDMKAMSNGFAPTQSQPKHQLTRQQKMELHQEQLLER